MSRTCTVENVWDLEEDFFSTFNEPTFGPSESFEVGFLSFDPLKDEVGSNVLPMEFDAVETLIPGQVEASCSPLVQTGLCLGTGPTGTPRVTLNRQVPSSGKPVSMPTVSMPAATLGYGPTTGIPKHSLQTTANGVTPIVNMTPSKNEIAELRYNFYSSKNYLASIRHHQDIPIIPQEPQFLNSNNFTDTSALFTPATIDTAPLRSMKALNDNKKDLVPPRGYKPPNDDLPSPNLMYSVLKFKEPLATLDANSLDEYILQVNKFRTLSIEEKDEVKVIYKRIKNREAARRSRRDKKDHVSDLETEVRQLKSQVEHMRMELASLRTENTFLKNEIQFTSTIISSNQTLTQLYTETTARCLNPMAQGNFNSGDPDLIGN